MDFLNLHELLEDRRRRQPVFLERRNFAVSAEFQQRFRLNPATAEHLVLRIGRQLAPATERSCALYHVLRDAHGPSAASVCRIVSKVSQAVNNKLFQEQVRWLADCQEVAGDFFRVAGLPSVCGLVDGTLVPIVALSVNEEQFVDRKGKHSLNVMLVSAPQHKFVACNASWPGSVNDARVLRNSSVHQAFENRGFRPFPDAVILGDSIYPCLDWLIPPVLGDNHPEAVRRFNNAHRRTRSAVERSIGLLQLRFPCLRMLRVATPQSAGEIVKTCVTLHNLCIHIEGGVDDDAVAEFQVAEAEAPAENAVAAAPIAAQGNRRRSRLIAGFAAAD